MILLCVHDNTIINIENLLKILIFMNDESHKVARK